MEKMFKLFSVLFVTALFLNDVMSYNSLLTYTIRFKKMTFLPNMTGNYTINQGREKQTVSSNFSCGFTDVDSIVAVFHRCNSEGIDCEYFQTWKFSDVCSVLKQKNQVWSSWYGAIRPLFGCPINKGRYELVKGYFEVSILKSVGTEILYGRCIRRRFHGGLFIFWIQKKTQVDT